MDFEQKEQVNHPSHYNIGKIEVADAIHDWKLDFFRGNVVKYVVRAGHKDQSKELEDLKKAKWYLEYSIAMLEKESARGQYMLTGALLKKNKQKKFSQLSICKSTYYLIIIRKFVVLEKKIHTTISSRKTIDFQRKTQYNIVEEKERRS